ncbi:MAG: hypothetical protein AAF843_08785 [Bacteroidota bacterium]
MKLIKEGKQLKLYLDEENNWLYADWYGKVNDKWVIEGLELIYEAISEEGVGVLLNDNTNLNGTWTGVIEYVINDWYPKALNAGYRKVAFVYSQDIFTRFSVDVLRKQDTDSPVDQKTFYSIEEAKVWLKQ